MGLRSTDGSERRCDYTKSWYVGLEWSDVFIEGNSFGLLLVSPPSTRR